MAFSRLTLLEAADERLKRAVWNKGRTIANYDGDTWRWDSCGNVMKYDQYGVCGEHGWEIDHIKPVSRGGTDDISNLQPLYWENNRAKGDTYPWTPQRAK